MARIRENKPKVAVFIEAVYYTSRRFLKGFLEYTRIYEPWTVTLKTGRNDEMSGLESGDYAGIVVEAPSDAVRRYAARKSVQVVTIIEGQKLPQPRPFPQVIANVNCEDRLVARRAAEYLLQQGFDKFAYVGMGVDLPWSRRRGRVFAQTVARVGATRMFTGGSLADFLKSLPIGTGLFVANDPRAQEVLEVAKEVGVDVPDDVAVISVDNEELLCETASPTLTSIAWNSHETGYEAARRLHAAISCPTKRPSYRDICSVPTEVVVRKSTARLQFSDAQVRRCLELMELNLAEKVSVSQLAKGVGLSRRTLERRFLKITGKSLGEALVDLRLARAEELLKRTSMPIAAIAVRCGFYDASHLSNVFRRAKGVNPSALRGEYR